MTGILASLLGSWVLDRTVDDGSAMAGEANFVPRCDDGVDYRERGLLTLPGGQSLDAERRFIFIENEGGFAVLFAETPPRLFHRVTLRRDGASLVGVATHLCSADLYETSYEFRPGEGFVVEHRVSGPRKRYVIVTRYWRRERGAP